jgi:hypothetical protein
MLLQNPPFLPKQSFSVSLDDETFRETDACLLSPMQGIAPHGI